MDKINVKLEIAEEVEKQVIDNGLELNVALRVATEKYKEKAPNQNRPK